MVYGTAGGAVTDIKASVGPLPWSSSTELGWTAGGGVEGAITDNVTAKVEYLYVGLPNAPCGLGSCGSSTTSVSLNENIIRGGFNFKFGGPGGFDFGW